MYSKEQLEMIYPYLLIAKSNKQKLADESLLPTPYNWQHNSRNCLMVGYYTDREARAEMKILKLLVHSSRQRLQLVNKANNFQKVPTDAEIVFGNCNCEKVFCRSCGWDKSRLYWLWELEQRQQQSLREQLISSSFSHSSTASSAINSIKSRRASKKPGCWSWLLQSCGYNLETGSSSNFSRSSLSV